MNFGRKKRNAQVRNTAVVQTVAKEKNILSGFTGFELQSRAERELYTSLREAVPIVDAAICKLVRLIGSFEIVADNKEVKLLANSLMKNVKTNGSAKGFEGFLYAYFDSLLTYGEAVGEMISGNGGIVALYNASLDDVEIIPDKSPLDVLVCRRESGSIVPVKYQNMILTSLLNPKPGTVCGTSILKGLPFVSSILLRIFSSIKTNWERIGDVRFAVTYNPEQGNGGFSKESATVIAQEWQKAMRSDSVCDFVAVGDVNVKVIGAENQMPDCDIPIRHITEQIIAKLGLPPFLLGLSWSSTERMSEQQADILTSELEYYRVLLEPVICKIINTHLRLNGYTDSFEIVWDDINLQDAVELSQARLNNAQALKLENELCLEGADE